MNARTSPATPTTLKSGEDHPSPHRDRVGPWSIGFGLLAAPLVWVVELLVNFGLAAYACYPHDIPLASALWGWLHGYLVVVDVVAVLVCAAATVVALRMWRKTRHERPGSGHHLMESGDGRTRFLAMTSVLTSLLFLVAVLLQVFNVFVVPACSG